MQDNDRPAPENSPAKRDSTPRPARHTHGTSDADMYRVAYEESQRTLDDQQDELKGMRDRAVQFTAFVGAATAFLVGTGLHTTTKDALFYTLAGIASGLSAALIVLLFILLMPSRKRLWHYRLSAGSLINGWIEAEVPPPNEAALVRAIAIKNDEMHRDNERLLGYLRKIYLYLIAIGAAQLTVWAALVWIKG